MKKRHKLQRWLKKWYSRLFQQTNWRISVYRHGMHYEDFLVRAGNDPDACEKARKQQPCLNTAGWSFTCAQLENQ